MDKLKGTLFEVKVDDTFHTILETSNDVEHEAVTSSRNSQYTFNLAMIDVSGSMNIYWNNIMHFWNEHISPELKGKTKIYVFGSNVYFRRDGTKLQDDDFFSQGTNLTDAIGTINSTIRKCEEKQVRIFLVTDGHHNATEITPDVEIRKLSIPVGKTIEVFLLGLGNGFPVNYSINIRSALHNGNSNVPSLFWVKSDNWNDEEIKPLILDQILSIADILKSRNVKLKLSLLGHLAPGFPETNTVHSGEFVYFPRPRSEIALSLNLSVEDDPSVKFESYLEDIDLQALLNGVFRQWNSLIIQHHRQKNDVPSTSFEVMEAIYKHFHERMQADLDSQEKNSLKYRLSKKRLKFLETEFATIMNQSKVIIGLEDQYSSEIQLAESILKTTVKSKYFLKNLKLKGHSAEDYDADIKQFTDIYEKIKDDIMALPEPLPDDCCRVTMGSMVKDLQDSSFPDLLREDKFTFLKTFTVTGLPIYAPVKDSSQINPWALCIRNILNSPFTIVSQSTLELSAEFGNISMASANKEVFLQKDDANTRFNAIIPVFTSQVAKVLQPLIRTNIFSMLASFCILKDPHIIDHNAHVAALGCAWMKVLMDHPSRNSRPQFAVEKLAQIQTTATVYLDRGGIAKYLKVLMTEPNQALMTESTEEYGDKTIKCESLIKPMFLLYLTKEKKYTTEKLLRILHLLMLEFIGRCMANYSKGDSSNECLYSHLFVPALYSEESRKEWFDKKMEEICTKILESFTRNFKGSFLQNFFKLEDLQKNLKSFCRQQHKQIEESMFEISVNQEMISGLKNESGAGNIVFESLKIFAEEMLLSEETVKSLFKEETIFVCVLHSLKNKGSRERLSEPLLTYDEALKEVKRLVASENMKKFRSLTLKRVMTAAEKTWRQEFMSVHESEIVKPMTRQEIMVAASKRGVLVTENNFEKVFRYNPKTGLLRNACMMKSCPFYLKPNRTFNQHLSVLRGNGFLHQLHIITLEYALKRSTADDVIKTILEGYRSVNKLKVPPTPSSEQLYAKKDGIFQLIKEYRILKGIE